jgi:hypothetical protein
MSRPLGAIETKIIYKYICDDFEMSWNQLSKLPKNAEGRGNFSFALNSMILLEFIYKVLYQSSDDKLLYLFEKELERRDARYFCKIKGANLRNDEKNFTLQFRTSSIKPIENTPPNLMKIIFNSIRHGHAHNYFQNLHKLSDGFLAINILGPNSLISEIKNEYNHMTYTRESNEIILNFSPGKFYKDIIDSVNGIDLIKEGNIFETRLRTNMSLISLDYFENLLVKSLINKRTDDSRSGIADPIGATGPGGPI